MEKNTVYKNILSDESQYGIIWDATFKGRECVVKMVMLQTNCFYDQKQKKYSSVGSLKSKDIHKLFQCDGPIPYLYSKFAKRKSMTRDDFLLEQSNMRQLSHLELGPKVLASWITHGKAVPIDFGFLVVEKGHCSLKDMIVRRKWNKEDYPIIYDVIEQMHKAGFIHGDLKPSNIIVWHDSKNRILDAKIIDAQKMKSKETVKEFSKLVKKDQTHFQEHIAKNQKERLA